MPTMFSGAVFLVFVLVFPISTAHAQTCTLGTVGLQKSSPNPTPGLFIQQEDRAPCSGLITQWTVCYYDPSTFTDRKTFQISMEIWRNESVRLFNLVGSNAVNIIVPDEPEDFQCVNISIDKDRHINVSRGDYIGVYNPSSSNLPMVTSNSGTSNSRVFFAQVSAIPPASVVVFGDGQPRATPLFNHAIHITAIIEELSTEFNSSVTKIPATQQLPEPFRNVNDTLTYSIVSTISTYSSLSSNDTNNSIDNSRTSIHSFFTSLVATSTTLGIFILLVPLIIVILVIVLLMRRANSKSKQTNQSEQCSTGLDAAEEDNSVDMSKNDSYGVFNTSTIKINANSSDTNISGFYTNIHLPNVEATNTSSHESIYE